MITDIHTHIYKEETYQTYFTKTKDKVFKVLVLHWYKFSLDKLLQFAASKDNLYVVGSVDLDKDIVKQITTIENHLRGRKVFGVKLYPGYQHFYPSDGRVYPVADLCQKYKVPLIFHSGDVYDPDGEAILKYAHPIYVDELAVKFPECIMVISHFGFPYLLETANIVSKNANVYTDISATITESDSGEDAKILFNQYCQDLKRVYSYFPDVKEKTMFGTDYGGEECPLNLVEPYIKIVESVFSEHEQKDVFYQLAKRLFFCAD